MVVRKSFVSMTTYDMATCLEMFTNISASVIFISRVEMHFHERYGMDWALSSEVLLGLQQLMRDFTGWNKILEFIHFVKEAF